MFRAQALPYLCRRIVYRPRMGQSGSLRILPINDTRFLAKADSEDGVLTQGKTIEFVLIISGVLHLILT